MMVSKAPSVQSTAQTEFCVIFASFAPSREPGPDLSATRADPRIAHALQRKAFPESHPRLGF
jgi:hypothetical protein